MKYQIAFLPGDGVGPEVLAEARRVLELGGRLFDRTFEIVEGAIGGTAIDRYDSPLPPPTVELCKNSQAVLLGAVGDKKYDSLPASKKPERGLLDLRTLLGNYANLRPVSCFRSAGRMAPTFARSSCAAWIWFSCASCWAESISELHGIGMRIAPSIRKSTRSMKCAVWRASRSRWRRAGARS